jgi:hypothetical protein
MRNIFTAFAHSRGIRQPASSFSLAFRNTGLKLRTPNWIRIDFIRLTVLVRNPRDLLPRLNDLVTPTIQKPQQLFPDQAQSSSAVRDHAGDEPAPESHFYDDYESAILHKGGAADLAVVVGFLQTTAASSGLGSAT